MPSDFLSNIDFKWQVFFGISISESGMHRLDFVNAAYTSLDVCHWLKCTGWVTQNIRHVSRLMVRCAYMHYIMKNKFARACQHCDVITNSIVLFSLTCWVSSASSGTYTTKTHRNKFGDGCDELVAAWLTSVRISSTEFDSIWCYNDENALTTNENKAANQKEMTDIRQNNNNGKNTISRKL